MREVVVYERDGRYYQRCATTTDDRDDRYDRHDHDRDWDD